MRNISRQAASSRKILLAVSGMSPQILTETLYALIKAPTPWIPDEVHLLTTVTGKNKAVLQLLTAQEDGRPGYFHRLLKDYRIKQAMTFDESTIHVIENQSRKALEDLRTPEDNEAAADYISDKIRELTAQPNTELHVSLAGGRKTMGFYAGYALSLFGRPQDRLSHVLVSSEYESLPNFFYPTPKTQVIHDRNNTPLDAAKAQVWQAEIPFVRLRGGLPKNLLKGNKSFSETIDLARKATEKPLLVIEPKQSRATINGEQAKLSPLHTLLLLWAALRAKNGKDAIQTLVEGEHNHRDANELLGICDKYLIDINEKTSTILKKNGVTKDFLETNISRLKTELEKKLGNELASLCKLAVVKNGKASGYALPDNLEISIR